MQVTHYAYCQALKFAIFFRSTKTPMGVAELPMG
jgi:hypothetical protein